MIAQEELWAGKAGLHSVSMKEEDFQRLSSLIKTELGIKMPWSKKTMLESRLMKRLRGLGIDSYSEYCRYLFSPEGGEQEYVHLIDAVTTNKTDFFRESAHFDYLLEKVLPELTGPDGPRHRKKVNIWSAGCATGEEPYTLAMVLSEYAGSHPGFSFTILGTDISTRALRKAELGVYDLERALPIPDAFKKKYMLKGKGQSAGLARVTPEIRACVNFQRLNFMDGDYCLGGHADVVFCRNVIIYFDRHTQEEMLTGISRYMTPGGYLFVGHSETLTGLSVPLSQVVATVYRKPNGQSCGRFPAGQRPTRAGRKV